MSNERQDTEQFRQTGPAGLGLLDRVILAALRTLLRLRALISAAENRTRFIVEKSDRLVPSLPVARLGHRPCRPRAARARPGRPPAAARPRVAPGRGSRRQGRLGFSFPGLPPAAGPSSRECLYPDSTTPPWSPWRSASSDRRGPVERRLAWVEGMQSSNGGWARSTPTTRATGSTRSPSSTWRLIDRRARTSPAHALQGPASRKSATPSRSPRGVEYLVREQQWDGSWWGRWGVNHVYGTGAALPALEACGFEPDASGDEARPWTGWTRSSTADGGFGEDIRSYHETAMARPRRHRPLHKRRGHY